MQHISLHRDNKVVLYCMDTKTERTGKCKIPQNTNGYPGKEGRQVQISSLDKLGSAIYPYKQMDIQEKTGMDIKTGLTWKCIYI